jgi:hypothetical protein
MSKHNDVLPDDLCTHTAIPIPTTRYVSNSEVAIDGRDERLRNILKGSSVKGMMSSGGSV